ncbi:DNA adenine methylase [Nocardiopsis tropica]|uniref:DNA adenine methylase n=1 Tax=Tsukamurella strandjordii TaxID=147577 RepID=UPI0031D69F35
MAESLSFTEKDGQAVDIQTSPGECLSPFLRWAGGKRWLVPEVRNMLRNSEIGDYHEPFLGGGAMFFGLGVSGEAHLSDMNSDLIEMYRSVRDNHLSVHRYLEQYDNTADCYYEVRSNVPRGRYQRAARFIFLNHTSYNGIYRVNLNGKYNVPFGRRENPQIPSKSALAAASRRLREAHLWVEDFSSSVARISSNDLVFLDPPYTVAHNNNGFVKYNERLFSFDDQRRIRNYLDEVQRRGAYFILTNAAHDSIAELFGDIGRRMVVHRRNSIGGGGAARGRADEYLFTNLREAHGDPG